MDQHKPTPTLISWTPDPLAVISKVWRFAKMPLSETYDLHPGTRQEQEELFNLLLDEWTGIPEFISFQFLVHNVNRAFLAQLTRHRLLSFFARSQRVDNMGTFATNGQYFTPDSCTPGAANPGLVKHREGCQCAMCTPNGINAVYALAMKHAEIAYNDLVKMGVPLEDARGVLPEHSLNAIAFSVNLRALTAMVRKRTCHILQQQYWTPFVQGMKQELVTKVDPALAAVFKSPCQVSGKCQTPMENYNRKHDPNDPNPPCPIWEHNYASTGQEGAGSLIAPKSDNQQMGSPSF